MVKMVVPALTIAAVILGFVSAMFWMKASAIKTPLPMAYLSGPPKEVVDRIEDQSKWNSRGAFFAALAALSQATALLMPLVSADA